MEYVTNYEKRMNIFDNTDVFDEAKEMIAIEAEVQGDIYNLAYNKGFDMKSFSEQYLQSDFCRYEMDSLYSSFQTELAECCMEEILYEFQKKGIQIPKRKDRFLYSPEWIGKMYRYLFFYLRQTSEELSKNVSFDELAPYDIDFWNCSIEEAADELKKTFNR